MRSKEGYGSTHCAPETRERIRAALIGRRHSEERRSAISAGMTAEARAKITGRPRSPVVGYVAVHERMRQELPAICAEADSSCKGRLEVSLRHDASEKLVDRIGIFSLNPNDYQRLCASHHHRYDRRSAHV